MHHNNFDTTFCQIHDTLKARVPPLTIPPVTPTLTTALNKGTVLLFHADAVTQNQVVRCPCLLKTMAYGPSFKKKEVVSQEVTCLEPSLKWETRSGCSSSSPVTMHTLTALLLVHYENLQSIKRYHLKEIRVIHS